MNFGCISRKDFVAFCFSRAVYINHANGYEAQHHPTLLSGITHVFTVDNINYMDEEENIVYHIYQAVFLQDSVQFVFSILLLESYHF